MIEQLLAALRSRGFHLGYPAGIAGIADAVRAHPPLRRPARRRPISRHPQYETAMHEAGHAVAALYFGFKVRYVQLDPAQCCTEDPVALHAACLKGERSPLLRRVLAFCLAGIEADRQISGWPWPSDSGDQRQFMKLLTEHMPETAAALSKGKRTKIIKAGYHEVTPETYPLATHLAEKVIYTNRDRITHLAIELIREPSQRMSGERCQAVAWEVPERWPPDEESEKFLDPDEWTMSYHTFGESAPSDEELTDEELDAFLE